jgi:hypothetical protein
MGLYLEAMGVATNSKGPSSSTRSTTAPVRVRRKGNYVRELGEGSYGFDSRTRSRRSGQHLGGGGGRRQVIKFNPEAA